MQLMARAGCLLLFLIGSSHCHEHATSSSLGLDVCHEEHVGNGYPGDARSLPDLVLAALSEEDQSLSLVQVKHLEPQLAHSRPKEVQSLSSSAALAPASTQERESKVQAEVEASGGNSLSLCFQKLDPKDPPFIGMCYCLAEQLRLVFLVLVIDVFVVLCMVKCCASSDKKNHKVVNSFLEVDKLLVDKFKCKTAAL